MKQAQSLSGSKIFAIVLVMVLLFAQALGLLHNIAHAGWHHHHHRADAAQRAAIEVFDEDARDMALFGHAADDGEHGDHHACAEFDAAAVADGIHIKFPLLIAMPSAHVLAQWRAFASWDAPVLTCFSSRAPPA